ncbi:MAG: COG3014 family protein [Pseudomonadota bacterium]
MHRKLLIVVGVALLLSGCATSSLFNPYPSQAAAFRQAAAGVDTVNVMAKLDNRRSSKDSTLYLMERARIAQLLGDFSTSKADFDQVITNLDAIADKATLSLGSAGATGAALLTNDNAIPYAGDAYERVMVHQYQAFNFLGLQDIEGATVELRRAQQVQRELELAHEKEVTAAQEEASKNNVQVGEFDSYFTGMDTIAGQVKNSFQNGYTFYMSAVIREALREYNDALVDFKKALEMSPANEELREDVIRLNRYFDRPAAPAAANGKPKPVAGGDARPALPGIVVVLYEQGFVPAKKPVGLAVPTLNGGIFSIQFPIYDGSDYLPATPLMLRLPDGSTRQTRTLVDTGALAIKAHREKVPGLLIRQVLRARAKYEMQKQAAEQGGLGGQLFANIYNLVSEQADLRSWLTLPANAQGARLVLPAGLQSIELIGAAGSLSVPVEVRGGRTTIVRVVEAGGRLIPQTFAL